MPMQSFVNPLPNLRVSHFLQFDFPVAQRLYSAPWPCLPNANLEPPGTEYLYGKLGTPKQEQGHPCLRELPFPEGEDPGWPYYHDQVLDLDRGISFNHTGRLSGSFVKYLAHDQYQSIVKMSAHPVTSGGSVINIDSTQKPLTPAAAGPNVWFWKDEKARNELIYTAHINLDPDEVAAKFKPENVYKLVCRWEFWDYSTRERARMPISGFDEAVAFEVIHRTDNM